MTIPDPTKISSLILSLEVLLCDDFMSGYRLSTWYDARRTWPDIGTYGYDEKFKIRIRTLLLFLKSFDETIYV